MVEPAAPASGAASPVRPPDLAIAIDIEPRERRMTLLLRNTGEKELGLRKGQPTAAWQKAGSLLQVFFEGYVGALGLRRLKCSAPAWQIATFEQGECLLAIAPREDMALRPGQTVMLVLEGLESPATVRGTFVVGLHGIGEPATPSEWRQITCAVQWESAGHRDLPLKVALEPAVVVADGIANDLRLVIANAGTEPLRCGDVTFELAFAEAPDAAQAEPDGTLLLDGADVRLEAKGPAGAQWSVTRGSTVASTRTWQIAAVKDADEAILGTGAAGVVSFVVTGVRARRAGVAAASLRYRNVPGHGDGLFSLPVVKKGSRPDGLPRGTIVLWSGTAATVPEGWALCDGTRGTPDLVSRFVRGAGGTLPKGATGGSEVHSHAATATVEIRPGGRHIHGLPSDWYANTASSGKGRAIVDRKNTAQPWYTQEVGDHTHAASAAVAVPQSEHLPPWLALCFIMKIA